MNSQKNRYHLYSHLKAQKREPAFTLCASCLNNKGTVSLCNVKVFSDEDNLHYSKAYYECSVCYWTAFSTYWTNVYRKHLASCRKKQKNK